MKKITKLLALILVCSLAFAVFTGCKKTDDNGDNNKGTENNSEKHTHDENGEWQFDKENHWKVCSEDGEKVSFGAHTFEYKECTVCKVRIGIERDEFTTYNVYNDAGFQTEAVSFYKDGRVVKTITEYTYDDNNNIKTSKTSTEGKVLEEAEWAFDENFGSYIEKNTVYREDGTKLYVEYNKYSETRKQIEYNADGSVVYEKSFEYEYDENDECVIKKSYENGKLVEETKRILFSEDDWGGKVYHYETTTYNEDGTKTVQVVDESGNKIS